MMKPIFKAGLAVVAAMALTATSAMAAWQPSGPIKLIIAFKAGGGADTQARLIAEGLQDRHGWEIVPEQVTGKGGVNAAMALNKEPADGSAIAMIVTESLGSGLLAAGAGKPTDWTGITTTAGTQMGVVAMTTSGYKNLGDVIAAAKGGKEIRFGAMSPALADLTYVIGKNNGVDFNIVMLKGGKGVMNGLTAGDIDVGWGAGIQTKAVVAGDMVNLASGIGAPLKVSPDAPLLSDYNVEFTNSTKFLIAGPGGLDPEARETLASAIADIVNDPESKANAIITKAFGGTLVMQGDELDAELQRGYDEAGKLMEAAK